MAKKKLVQMDFLKIVKLQIFGRNIRQKYSAKIFDKDYFFFKNCQVAKYSGEIFAINILHTKDTQQI